MTTYTFRAFLAVLGLCLVTTAYGGPPTTYPSFKGQQTSQFIIVGDFSKGTSLPQVKSTCPEGSVCINLNPPPFWFEVDVNSTIHGKDAPAKFYAVTGSHWGPQGYGSGKPVLAKFETNGSEFEMLRYAKRDLDRKKDGSLHLVLHSDYKIHWLPCSISSLREEISPDDFAGNLEIAAEDFDRYRVKDNAAFFRMTPAGAVPRYAISIARLQAHLQELAPGDKLSCD